MTVGVGGTFWYICGIRLVYFDILFVYFRHTFGMFSVWYAFGVRLVYFGWVGLGWVGLGWVGLGWFGLGFAQVNTKCTQGARVALLAPFKC